MSDTPGSTIAVIGGGASGCMAAITAAQAGCRVYLFEKNEKPAKKILATGNGRCNLTNLYLDDSCYHTSCIPDPLNGAKDTGKDDISRVLSVISRFSSDDLIGFFREAGVPVHDRDGYVYPRTDQAETIAGALEKCMRQAGVRVMAGCVVQQIDRISSGDDNSPFRVRYYLNTTKKGLTAEKNFSAKKSFIADKNHSSKKDNSAHKECITKKTVAKTGKEPVPRKEVSFYCDAVILCTGGMAGPAFGCSGDGYRFAEHFRHRIILPLPALTRLECKDPLLRRAAGVRCHASVTLQESCVCEDGELQITENSISGIPVFQLSGAAARLLSEGRKAHVRIDFLPEFTGEAFEEEIQRRLAQDRNQMLGELLLGLVHKKVIDLVLAKSNLQAEMKARRLTDEDLRNLLYRFRSFTLEITGTGGFDHAQVTSGGVPLDEVDDSLASLKCRGLFLAGELLDVDGRCGGYNLQWAMSSGVLAAHAAVRYLQTTDTGRQSAHCAQIP